MNFRDYLVKEMDRQYIETGSVSPPPNYYADGPNEDDFDGSDDDTPGNHDAEDLDDDEDEDLEEELEEVKDSPDELSDDE